MAKAKVHKKMKTHKSASKRFKVTGTGKIMRLCAGRSHLNTHKTSKVKRRLDKSVVTSTANRAKLAFQLPYPQYS